MCVCLCVCVCQCMREGEREREEIGSARVRACVSEGVNQSNYLVYS